MLHGINQFEAQYAASAAAHEALRRQVATHHALREAGLPAGRNSFTAKVVTVVRRIVLGRPAMEMRRPAIDLEAFGD